VPDSRIEQARSFLLTEAELSPREDWEAALDPAMDEAQRELQLEIVDAYLGGDVDSIVEHAHPDVEIVQAQELPGARSYHGREGMLEALLDWPLQWERFVLTPRRIFAVDDEWVLTVALHTGRAKIGRARLGGAVARPPDHPLGDIHDGRRGARGRCLAAPGMRWLARSHPSSEGGRPCPST
jgi:hypothetical protein